MPVGTILNVEHLFYNVPVRKKFLRQPSTEAGHIRAMIERAALVHPARRFSLVVDGKLVFQSTGSGDALEVLAKIYSLDEAKQMVPIGRNQGDGQSEIGATLPDEIDFMDDIDPIHHPPFTLHPSVLVSGYVSLPTLTRANRSYIDLFVNRRPIEDRSLAHAIVQAYHTLLPTGRYPLAALFIEVDPSHLDVNVHPRKAEVRFLQARQVFSEVQKAVRRVIVQRATVPGLALAHSASPLRPESPAVAWQSAPSVSRPVHSALEPIDTAQAEMDLFVPPHLRRESTEIKPLPMAAPPLPAVPAPAVSSPIVPPAPRKLPPLRVVGQVGAMYVVAEGPEGVYLIDQHAAHERIMYEKFMAERYGKGIARQGLLDPLTLHVGSERAGLVAAHLAELNAVGFEIEAFGGDTFLVRAVPSALSDGDAERVLDEIVNGLSQDRDLVGEALEAQLVKMVCKRASIKAGQVLSDIEMKELVRQLEECQSPRTCPHGRPTMIQLSANELEKAFKRT